MSHRRYLSTVLIIFCVSFLSACEVVDETYTITVRNQLDADLTVKLDGVFKGTVAPDGELVIKDVDGGTHLLQGEAEGYEPLAREVDLERDFTWVIY